MPKVTLTARVEALEGLFEKEKEKSALLEARVAVLERNALQMASMMGPFEVLFLPGKPAGDLLAACLENPENTEKIITAWLDSIVDHVVGIMEQHTHALAESHGIDPRPPRTLHAVLKAGFITTQKQKRG
jgi:hypothetical protein